MKVDEWENGSLNLLGCKMGVYRSILELAIAKMEEPKLSMRAAK